MCDRRVDSEVVTVWTSSTQNTGVTHALTGSMPVSRAVKGWSSLLVGRNSGACSVEVGLQYSDDDENWDAAVAFGPAATSTEGRTSDTQFRDLTVLGTRKRFVRFVAIATNPSSGAVEYCDVQLSLILTGTD